MRLTNESNAPETVAGFCWCQGCGEAGWEPHSATSCCWVCGSTDWVVLPSSPQAVRATLDEIERHVRARNAKLEAAGWPHEERRAPRAS